MEESLLTVSGLKVRIGSREPVRDSSFSIKSGSAKALIGESGCGKTMTASAIIGLLPENASADGIVAYRNRNILNMDERQLSAIRGSEISMICQSADGALNPVYRIGKQIERIARINGNDDAAERAEALLKATGIAGAGRKYPHQLSGGMQQRALIAAAISSSPSLLIADEMTSALDRKTEAEIMDLLVSLMTTQGLSMLFISHSIALASAYSDSVAVMHGGFTVEDGDTADVISSPRHPYTELLIRTSRLERNPDGTFLTIKGSMPGSWEKIKGCSFARRCPYAEKICFSETPEWKYDGNHRWRCIHG